MLILGLLRKSTDGAKHTKEKLQKDSSDKDGVLATNEETCEIKCSGDIGGYCVLTLVDCHDAGAVEPHNTEAASGNSTSGLNTNSTIDAGPIGEMQTDTQYKAHLALVRKPIQRTRGGTL